MSRIPNGEMAVGSVPLPTAWVNHVWDSKPFYPHITPARRRGAKGLVNTTIHESVNHSHPHVYRLSPLVEPDADLSVRSSGGAMPPSPSWDDVKHILRRMPPGLSLSCHDAGVDANLLLRLPFPSHIPTDVNNKFYPGYSPYPGFCWNRCKHSTSVALPFPSPIPADVNTFGSDSLLKHSSSSTPMLE
ncbi:hypothetical protein ONZ45_g3334 [Pleurotus djamor]|nr:hypothetical protein ONZ45_g3334 [Pleurotus djamor]